MWTKKEKLKLHSRSFLNFTFAKEVRENKLGIFFPDYYRHSQPVATVGKPLFSIYHHYISQSSSVSRKIK